MNVLQKSTTFIAPKMGQGQRMNEMRRDESLFSLAGNFDLDM